MPIVDPNEAKDLDEAIERLINADSAADRETRLRSVFVEKLDFSPAVGVIDLRGERCPTEQAVRIAEAEGVRVVWAPLSSIRILISDTRAVSKALTGLLGDHLLVASSERVKWSRTALRFPRRRRSASFPAAATRSIRGRLLAQLVSPPNLPAKAFAEFALPRRGLFCRVGVLEAIGFLRVPYYELQSLTPPALLGG